MASFVSSPTLKNVQSYKLLGFLGDFASQGLIIYTLPGESPATPPFPLRHAREFQLCWFLACPTHDRILFFFEIWIVTTSLYLAIPNTWGLSSNGGSRFSFILRHVFLISDMIWEANI